MTEFELVAPSDIGEVEPWLASQGFEFKEMGSSIPGVMHWHVRRPGVSGTLELTWDPHVNRFTMTRRSNREAPWIDEAYDLVVARFGPAMEERGQF